MSRPNVSLARIGHDNRAEPRPFLGQSERRADVLRCPLLTQSGHEQLRIAAVQTDP